MGSIQLSLKYTATEKKSTLQETFFLTPESETSRELHCSAPPATQLSDLAQITSQDSSTQLFQDLVAVHETNQDFHCLPVHEDLGESRYLFPST